MCDRRTMNAFPQTDRTRVRRLPARASYDVETVHAILDAGLVCHVGFVEHGRPIVIPTAYARVGDTVVFHGSSKSRTLLAATGGAELCISVALIDGLVLARSAFHHSVNYRSVVLFGRAAEITEPERKMAALRAFTERLYPGRWDAVRAPSEQELKATRGPGAAACRGGRQGPHRRADRRRGGHDVAGVGGRRAAAARVRCARAGARAGARSGAPGDRVAAAVS